MYATLFYCLLVAGVISALLRFQIKPKLIAWGAAAVFSLLSAFLLTFGDIEDGHIEIPGWAVALFFGGGGLLSTAITLLVHCASATPPTRPEIKDQG